MYWKVELLTQDCLSYEAGILTNCQEPFKMTELPSRSWENIVEDFKGLLPSRNYLVVVIDRYSGFVEIEITKSTSVKSEISIKVFSSFGIPSKVKS